MIARLLKITYFMFCIAFAPGIMLGVFLLKVML